MTGYPKFFDQSDLCAMNDLHLGPSVDGRWTFISFRSSSMVSDGALEAGWQFRQPDGEWGLLPEPDGRPVQCLPPDGDDVLSRAGQTLEDIMSLIGGPESDKAPTIESECVRCGCVIVQRYFGGWTHRGAEGQWVGCRAASYSRGKWDDSMARWWKATPPKDLRNTGGVR